MMIYDVYKIKKNLLQCIAEYDKVIVAEMKTNTLGEKMYIF